MRWEREKLSRGSKARRKCRASRGLYFWQSSIRQSRRLRRNLLQNPLKQHVPLMPSVVPEAVFIQVGLQVLRADVVIHAPDSTLHSAPKAFDSVGVHVARDIHAL